MKIPQFEINVGRALPDSLPLIVNRDGGQCPPYKNFFFLVPTLQRGNAYEVRVGMGSHGGPWEPKSKTVGYATGT